MFFVAERIARPYLLEARDSDDEPSLGAVHLLTLVGVHTKDSSHALAAAGICIVYRRSALNGAGIDAAECEPADKGVDHYFKGESRERFVGRRFDLYFLRRIVGINRYDMRHVQRAGQIGHNRVEQWLHALVLKCRTAHYRYDVEADSGLTDDSLHHFKGNFAALKIELHHLVIIIGEHFKHFHSREGRLFLKLRRDIRAVEFRSQAVIINDRLFVNEIHHAGKAVFDTDRNLNGNRFCPQTLTHLVDDREEICAYPVHFVDECYPRYTVFVGLTPNCL